MAGPFRGRETRIGLLLAVLFSLGTQGFQVPQSHNVPAIPMRRSRAVLLAAKEPKTKTVEARKFALPGLNLTSLAARTNITLPATLMNLTFPTGFVGGIVVGGFLTARLLIVPVEIEPSLRESNAPRFPFTYSFPPRHHHVRPALPHDQAWTFST